MESFSVLLVEDDVVFSEEFSDFLAAFGFRTTCCAGFDEAIRLVRGTRFDAVLLDQFVHGRDALPVLPDIRRCYDGPVIVITNNPEIADRVVGLESGADDFVLKLAGPREILARIRSVMRRRLATSEAELAEPSARPAPAPSATGWRVAMPTREIFNPAGERLELTSAEFDLLVFLVRRRGQLVRRDEVLRAYGGVRGPRQATRAADGMISRLRTILAPSLGGASAIKSVRGRGYVFVGFDLAGEGWR